MGRAVDQADWVSPVTCWDGLGDPGRGASHPRVGFGDQRRRAKLSEHRTRPGQTVDRLRLAQTHQAPSRSKGGSPHLQRVAEGVPPLGCLLVSGEGLLDLSSGLPQDGLGGEQAELVAAGMDGEVFEQSHRQV